MTDRAGFVAILDEMAAGWNEGRAARVAACPAPDIGDVLGGARVRGVVLVAVGVHHEDAVAQDRHHVCHVQCHREADVLGEPPSHKISTRARVADRPREVTFDPW